MLLNGVSALARRCKRGCRYFLPDCFLDLFTERILYRYFNRVRLCIRKTKNLQLFTDALRIAKQELIKNTERSGRNGFLHKHTGRANCRQEQRIETINSEGNTKIKKNYG